MAASSRAKDKTDAYIIATLEVDPDTLLKLDTKMSSREKDGITIKMPSQTNICPIQLWEVYLAVGILCSQPHSGHMQEHVRAVCNHDEATYLVEALLRDFLIHPNVIEVHQDCNLFVFFEEYMHRKFQISFSPGSILKYVTESVDDTLCGQDDIPRSYLLAPFVQAMLTAAQFWEGQYDEMIDSMRMINLPVNDVMLDDDEEIGETVGVINWDNAKLYDDPAMILKKYGGWAIGKTAPMLTRHIAARSVVTVGSQMKGNDIGLQAGRTWDAGVADNFEKTTLDKLFGGKKVVLFALPGAYTGVCEKGHVPSYAKNAAALKAKGVDTIACVSVNDPYTMHAWATSMGAADDIAFFGDADGSFTEFVGQALDLNVAGLGPGKRSNRYSMLVEDGVVKEMKVEEGAADLKVSDGDTMLAAL